VTDSDAKGTNESERKGNTPTDHRCVTKLTRAEGISDTGPHKAVTLTRAERRTAMYVDQRGRMSEEGWNDHDQTLRR
jgi:hypothetical protein